MTHTKIEEIAKNIKADTEGELYFIKKMELSLMSVACCGR